MRLISQCLYKDYMIKKLSDFKNGKNIFKGVQYKPKTKRALLVNRL